MRQLSLWRVRGDRFKFRIERPRQHANPLFPDLLFLHVIRRVPARRKHDIRVTQRQPPQSREWFPHFHAVSANNVSEPRCHNFHRLRDRSQIGMTRKHHLRTPSRRPNRRCRKQEAC